jgi:hypothetical protein
MGLRINSILQLLLSLVFHVGGKMDMLAECSTTGPHPQVSYSYNQQHYCYSFTYLFCSAGDQAQGFVHVLGPQTQGPQTSSFVLNGT